MITVLIILYILFSSIALVMYEYFWCFHGYSFMFSDLIGLVSFTLLFQNVFTIIFVWYWIRLRIFKNKTQKSSWHFYWDHVKFIECPRTFAFPLVHLVLCLSMFYDFVHIDLAYSLLGLLLDILSFWLLLSVMPFLL